MFISKLNFYVGAILKVQKQTLHKEALFYILFFYSQWVSRLLLTSSMHLNNFQDFGWVCFQLKLLSKVLTGERLWLVMPHLFHNLDAFIM